VPFRDARPPRQNCRYALASEASPGNLSAVDTIGSEGRSASMTDDVQSIKNVVYLYAELLDLGDIDGLATLFTKATVRTHGSEQELRGADAVKQLIQGSVHLYEGIPSTKHVVTNIIVEIADARRSATARSYWTAFQARPELPLQPILAGRWHDGLERGRRRLAHRRAGDLRRPHRRPSLPHQGSPVTTHRGHIQSAQI
jgi:hypothetical protein